MKSNCSAIIKYLQKQCISPDTIDFISGQIKVRDERIDSQSRALELANREIVPIEDRHISTEIVLSSNSKLTVNPCTGRVSLKISNSATEETKQDMRKLAEIVLTDKDFSPVTMRGRIKFHDGKYKLNLISESKRFTKYYEMEG